MIDIRKLYGATGAFTFDPGFTSAAACRSALTYLSTATPCYGYPIDQLASVNFVEVYYLRLLSLVPVRNLVLRSVTW